MSSALGSAFVPAGAAARAPFGTYRLNVLDYGAQPGNVGGFPFDNAPAFQRAVDAAAALVQASANAAASVVIEVPGNAAGYYLYSTVFLDSGQIAFEGDGDASQLMQLGPGGPLFLLGVPRANGAQVASAAYRPDLFGLVDATMCAGSNQLWGFRTNGDGFLWTQGSPFTHGGSRYSSSGGLPSTWLVERKLTVEAFIQGYSGGAAAVLPAGDLFGCGPKYSGPCEPFWAYVQGGNLCVTLSTQAGQFGAISDTTATFPIGAATTARRLAIQFDLDNLAAPVSAWLDGIQQTVTLAGVAPLPAGSIFRQTQAGTFFLGGANFGASGSDVAFYGFCMSNSLRYANRGAGTTNVQNPQVLIGLTGIVPQITMAGAPTGGTWTCSYGGQTTGPLAYNITAAALQTALTGLSTIGPGNVTVTGTGPANDPYVITPAGSFAFPVIQTFGVAPATLSADGSSLTGGTVTDAFRYTPASGGGGGSTTTDPNLIGCIPWTECPLAAAQTAVVTTPPGGGGAGAGSTYTLSYGGQTTAPLGGGSSAATVQAAFTGLSSVGAGNATVVGTGAPGVNGAGMQLAITLTGTLATASASGITVNGSGILGAGINIAPHPPRWLNLTGGYNKCSNGAGALFLGQNGLINYGGKDNVGARKLRLSCGPYGKGITLGPSLNDRVERCGIYSGIYAIDTLPTAANYTHVIDDITFSGSDIGIVGNSAEFWGQNWKAAGSGRITVYMNSCNLHLRNFSGGQTGNNAEIGISLQGGGYGDGSEIADFANDAEGGGYAYAALVATRGTDTTGTILDITNFKPQTVGACPIFRLEAGQTGPQFPGGVFRARGVYARSGGLSVVSADTNAWTFDIDHVKTKTVQHVTDLTADGRPAGTVREAMRTPPHGSGKWTAGTSTVPVLAPVDGQPDVIRCRGTGQVGTPTPPLWVANAQGIQANPATSLAGYALGHHTFGATLNGVASAYGALTTDYAVSPINQWLLGGPAPTLPTTWYLALSTFPTLDRGSYHTEVTAAGYARQVLPAIGLASAGSKASTAAVAWPAMTSAQTIGAVLLMDAQVGGNCWGIISFLHGTTTGGVTIPAGTAPSIASGALTFANAPMPGQWGGMSDYLFGKVYDRMLNGAAFAPPTSYYLALSASAVTRSAGPTEPVGNGYSRAAIPNVPATWSALWGSPYATFQAGDAYNLAAITLFTPTGSLGSLPGACLMDAATGGNVLFPVGLPAPIAPTAAGGAPTIAAGGLFLNPVG